MSHLTKQKQVEIESKTRSEDERKEPRGGEDVSHNVTICPWGQKMFVAGSGGGWGSTSPLLVTLRGKQLMMWSKGSTGRTDYRGSPNNAFIARMVC